MARIEIKVILDDETEIGVAQTIKADRQGEEASIPSIGATLLGSAVPSVVRALGLRTQQDETELMEQVAARASEMLQQVREAEADEAAAAAEHDAQVEAAIDEHFGEDVRDAPENNKAAEADKHKPWVETSSEEVGPEAPAGSVEEIAEKAVSRAGKPRRR